MINEVAGAIQTMAPKGEGLDAPSALTAARWLDIFGYLEGMQHLGELIERIKNAQQTLQVKQDGWIGDETYKAQRTQKRCGLKDVYRAGGQIDQWLRSKATSGDGLTYHFIRYVNYLSPAQQEDLTVRYLTKWENACGVKFHRLKSEQADIIIDASSSRQEEFGTVGNVLAWAYKPQGTQSTRQLLIKFDLAEQWDDVLYHDTGCHEFGHILGLDHTQVVGELMYPSIQQTIHGPQARYDIPQVQQRYGQPVIIPVPTPAPGPIKVEGTISLNGLPYKLTRV